MRVLFIVQRFHTNMIPMVDALLQHGHSVAIVSSRREGIEDYTLMEPRLVNPFSLDQTAAESLINDIQPDLVVLRDVRGGFPLAAAYAKAQGARTVVYNQQPYTRPRGPRGLKRDLERVLSARRAGLPLRTITPVYGQPQDAPKFLTKFFKFPMQLDEVPEQRHSQSGRSLTVLCVGKLAQPRKRHVWLLDAVESLDLPCRVVLAGAGNDLQFDDGTRSLGYYTSLVERCGRMRGNVRVDVLQDLSYADARRLYSLSSVFVLPSEREDAAVSPLEAMAAGCAVLVPDANGTSCYVTNGVDGLLFKEQDYADFASKLRQLLTSPDFAADLGAHARRTVGAQHSYDMFVRMLLSA